MPLFDFLSTLLSVVRYNRTVFLSFLTLFSLSPLLTPGDVVAVFLHYPLTIHLGSCTNLENSPQDESSCSDL